MSFLRLRSRIPEIPAEMIIFAGNQEVNVV
jgi:hypothetical protein